MSAAVERAVRLGAEVCLLVCRAVDADEARPPFPGRRAQDVLQVPCEDFLLLAVAIPAESTELEIAAGPAAVKAFARDYLAPAPATTRDRIVEVLSQTMGWEDPHEAVLAENLRLLRDGLRESAISVRDHVDRVALTTEYLALVDREQLYIRGWLRDSDGTVTGLDAIAPEGSRVSLLDGAYRYPRPDVVGRSALGRRTKNGFIGSHRLPVPSLLADGWVLEAQRSGEPPIEVPAPKLATNTLAIRDTVLEDALTGYLPSDDLLREHVFPAVDRIQELIHAHAEVESVLQLGEPPRDPSVSIVIPLYERLDHLKYQLSQFADDADMARADLIYVLDSPDQAEDLGEAVRQLFPIYGVPLRVCITGANLGFAGASNAGASIARSDLLLMMNSDVLPDRPGWLSKLAQFYRNTPGCDVLGPKLLHEDGSIQHAGMYLQRFAGSDVWRDAHYFKGLTRTFPGANEARAVPAVSGACMMVDRALFEELGGFPYCYVRGDYEDYDFCLRAFTRGRATWYWPGVELFHIEAQSYASELRIAASRYNAWLHTHLWGDEIERLMGGFTDQSSDQEPAWEEASSER
jgi:O-antigen biosynthesis protein